MLAGVSWADLRQKYDDKFIFLFRALMAFGAGKEKRAREIAYKHIKNRALLTDFRQDIEAYFVREEITPTPEFCKWIYEESRHNPSVVINFNGQRKRKKSKPKHSVLPTIFEQEVSTVESPTP
tara:strand:+ start:101088 stop:101456 length:369 start_codon:yes stop_codon:yes gene_type:complete